MHVEFKDTCSYQISSLSHAECSVSKKPYFGQGLHDIMVHYFLHTAKTGFGLIVPVDNLNFSNTFLLFS